MLTNESEIITLQNMHIRIRGDENVLVASQTGRAMAAQVGFSASAQTAVGIAILEITRNAIKYARDGEITIRTVRRTADDRLGIEMIVQDTGPGIKDVEKVLQGGYTSGNGLGLGIAGAKRLMDEFEIVSQLRKGTLVRMRKWKP